MDTQTHAGELPKVDIPTESSADQKKSTPTSVEKRKAAESNEPSSSGKILCLPVVPKHDDGAEELPLAPPPNVPRSTPDVGPLFLFPKSPL